jgi:hypothetical protein
MRLAVVEGESAENAFAVTQRCGEHRAIAFGRVGLAKRRREPIGLRDLFGDHRFCQRDGGRAALHGTLGIRDVRVRETGVDRDAPGVSRLVVLPHRVSVGSQRATREVEDRRQHRLDAE